MYRDMNAHTEAMHQFSLLMICLMFVMLFIQCESSSDMVVFEEVSGIKVEMTRLSLSSDAEIPIDEFGAVTLTEITPDGTSDLSARIKRRGGFSISFPKHSYELDLPADYALAGLPADDDWILNANYIDKTFLRHVMSYDLFRAMNPNNRASLNRYIELELDGMYQGLYVLMEKLDKSALKIDGDDSASVIFKEPHIFRASYEGVTPQKQNNFHQQTFPKIGEDDRTMTIDAARDFIMNATDDEFSDGIGQVFDIQNIIDWHLLLLVSNNGDGILKNFYLYQVDSITPLRVAPWDYDHSFGRDGDNELNLDERQAQLDRSILLSRLLTLPWYRQQLKDSWHRYNEEGLLSASGLKDRVRRMADEIRPYAEKNFELWNVDASAYYDDNGFAEEIDVMEVFIDLRSERLRIYFEDL